jgi:hypothetical protein
MPIQLCVDFLMFPDNHTFPSPSFSFGGFKFAGSGMFVNVTGGSRGLQFLNSGIKIMLPAPAVKVRLKIGQFATPIGVKVIVGGVTIASSINQPNAYSVHTFGPWKKRATMVGLAGGNNEGIVAQICAWV